MKDQDNFDALFQQAVSAVDAGNESGLKQLLDAHPELVTQRLYQPGEWLTNVIGNALNSFFQYPYLLWFVSEDAVRNHTLPHNITNIACIIIDKIKAVNSESLKEQLDYTLKLVAWSTVARDCGVQIQLLDVLVDAGADKEGVSDSALVNRNTDAAKHLIKRGAQLTLSTALCLEHWQEADQLAASASDDEKQFSLVLACLNGKAKAVVRALSYGAMVNNPSNHLYAHGTPLHHAVWSGSLDTVKVLLDAGAYIDAVDTAWNRTPLGWAEYGKHKKIADYLSMRVQ